MKKRAFFQAFVLLVCIFGLAAIHGCGGGGGGGGTSTAVAPSVSTASLLPGVLNQPYDASLAATNGTPPYTWSVPPGSLPTGITLSAAGALTGTPTATGTFPLTLTVMDANGLTGSKPLSILINSPVVSPIVATAALPSGIQGQPYSATLVATSGTSPYTWSITAGSPPTGVVLSAGALTGTPTVAGTFPLTLTVTDINGLTGSKPLSILINPSGSSSPVIATSSLPDGARTEPYSVALSATGGTPPYAWSATGLPTGIVLSVAGALTGTPSVEGTFSPVFTVTDSLGMQAQKSLALWIAKPLVLSVSDYSTPSGAVNTFDNASVANGVSAWTRQLKGALTTLDNAVGGPPAGVSYDAARKILYVARTLGSDNGAVLAFNNADTVNGNVTPDRIIRTFTMTATSPSDVFIDSGKDRIYIAYVQGSSGFILLLDSASATPVFRRNIDFPYGPPAAISVDTARDILYVVPSQGTGFIAYDNVSNPSGGVRTIAINSAGVGLVDVKIDPATDTAYAADYGGGRVFVINTVSQKNGTYAPDRTLTGLSNPNSVFPDVANDRLFVSNRDGATSYSVRVVENMSTVNGSVSFSRTLSGFGTAAGMTGYYK